LLSSSDLFDRFSALLLLVFLSSRVLPST
jgi:hypothetical protein